MGAAQHALNACYFGCRGRSFRGGTARTQCVLPRLLRAFFRGRHSAQSMRATSVAPCAGKSNFLVRGRRDAFAALRGYGCPDASGTEACQETTHVQSSWGGSEGERALTPRTRDDFLFFFITTPIPLILYFGDRVVGGPRSLCLRLTKRAVDAGFFGGSLLPPLGQPCPRSKGGETPL